MTQLQIAPRHKYTAPPIRTPQWNEEVQELTAYLEALLWALVQAGSFANVDEARRILEAHGLARRLARMAKDALTQLAAPEGQAP